MERTNRLPLLPDELITLVWGPVIIPKFFSRWSQGFTFSKDENTALTQSSGGPCAAIAPLQAFLLKRLISFYPYQQLKELDSTTMDRHLASIITEVLCQSTIGIESCRVPGEMPTIGEASSSPGGEGPFRLACLDDPLPAARERSPISPAEIDNIMPEAQNKDFDLFHSCIRLRHFESKHDLEDYLESNLIKFKVDFGILLFLYSVILTRGINRIRDEMGESGESLIDHIQGHGSQALINLLICGRASSYVWDGDKDIGGLTLSGIVHRPTIGFLTKLEDLHYVQVGWFLKNPSSSVWVLASETHLTVLFSWSRMLVTPDSGTERAKQILSWFDAEGNKFIQRCQFKEVLSKLNLCTDEDYIEFMCKELDPENVGVILFQSILDAFYEVENSYCPPDTFTVYHYNGLESSCPKNKIAYAEGCVTLQESYIGFKSNSEILSCLSTKWPNLDIQWHTYEPSLN